jgi:hypothetical protein
VSPMQSRSAAADRLPRSFLKLDSGKTATSDGTLPTACSTTSGRRQLQSGTQPAQYSLLQLELAAIGLR